MIIFLLVLCQLQAQRIKGEVHADGSVLPFANIAVRGTAYGAVANDEGIFEIRDLLPGKYQLEISYTGFVTVYRKVVLSEKDVFIKVELLPDDELDEVVVSGTLKPVSRMETPVPVEVYKPAFFQKNPSSNVFEALQQVNGVRPQINCNVCNTGDIHINGLEGPYTMVLIDGMPIVSGLSTVYGLSGIPNSLIERVEIVKGPASSLYGSEAVGGLINIITKDPELSGTFTADSYLTGYGAYNLDLGFKMSVGEIATTLLGVNYFNYDHPVDNNQDNFTDVTLQHRISVFDKFSFRRPENRVFRLAGRFFYEDRWGGEMQWTSEYRGGDEVYGESIYTKRWEVLGEYQLPVDPDLMFTFSYTDHDQNSWYGNTPFMAVQRIGFARLTWDQELGSHSLLSGISGRYNFYDDNTPATENAHGNLPDEVMIPGVFVQDEWRFDEKRSLLTGFRYDYDKRHGNIFTPRLAFKWKLTDTDILRLNAGTGFRVVNLFTEDHAALTGAREVVIEESLKPERSWNINLNYLKKVYSGSGNYLEMEMSAWYTYFNNIILPDYDTDPDQILYRNLDGYATTTGFSVNLDYHLANGLKFSFGGTLMDVKKNDGGETIRPVLTERFSSTWGISYTIIPWNLKIDYTGNLYGPMRLPLAGDLDPRNPDSPVWSIQNIQFTYIRSKKFEFYGGVKNLLDWTPDKGNPFLIARAEDPFDKNVEYDNDGNVMSTPDNPYALTFDPSYVYAPNQGVRVFAGLRCFID
ncbi:TonB-dependent receptor [Robertkochia solimangrovi]|uniref:TonB-dependent receptor n=1 Tax=Robertkochia solimangrovi TaxID=2213046 RepID=UPI001F54CEFA|nr:TonB-dependent receptor [Robertkochia solimangrovi]